MDGEQIAFRPRRHARGAAHEAVAVGGARERDDDPLARLPGPVDPVPLAVVLERVVDAVGDPEERELAQGTEVPGAEVVAERGVDALGGIDVPVRHAAPDRLRRHVHELDLVGPPDDRVRDRLLLLDPGDLLDDVVDRLEVLDVQGRDHRDAGVEQVLDVLPALLVREPGTFVCASSSTSATSGRRARIASRSISSNVVPRYSTRPARYDLEVGDLLGGLRSAVRLDEADDDVRASLGPAVPLAQHRECLADAGRGTEVDA